MLQNPAEHRVQILISEVLPGSTAGPRLRRWGYRVDAEYFYPASSIKLCAAVAALQMLEELENSGSPSELAWIPLQIDPLFPGDTPQFLDPSHQASGSITVAHEVRKLCLVSDNRAFNRLFDLVGHEGLNLRMHSLGLRSTVLNHRLSEVRSIPNPQASAGVRFLREGKVVAQVPPRTSSWVLANRSARTQVGTAHLSGGHKIDKPMSFDRRNGMSLVDLQDLLIKLVRPDVRMATPPLQLSERHRTLLMEPMTAYPRESKDPVYLAKDHPDESCKFLLPGVRRIFPDAVPGRRIEITGKIGRAYGFTVENSYLFNPANGRAVFVSAVLYTNQDGVLNDDQYEYVTVADPYFEAMGEWIATRWLGGTQHSVSPARSAMAPGFRVQPAVDDWRFQNSAWSWRVGR